MLKCKRELALRLGTHQMGYGWIRGYLDTFSQNDVRKEHLTQS